jgi:hypothetical protein
MTPDPPPVHTFVLRVWLERGEGDPCEWRGELKRVPTGETAYFRTLEALAGLLLQLVRAREADAAADRP